MKLEIFGSEDPMKTVFLPPSANLVFYMKLEIYMKVEIFIKDGKAFRMAKRNLRRKRTVVPDRCFPDSSDS